MAGIYGSRAIQPTRAIELFARGDGVRRRNALEELASQRADQQLQMQESQNAFAREDADRRFGLQERQFEYRQGQDAAARARAGAATGRANAEAERANLMQAQQALYGALQRVPDEQWDAVGPSLVAEVSRTFGVEGTWDGYEAEKRASMLYAQPESGWRPATQEEATQYGASSGQFGPDGRFYPGKGPGMTVYGPDGKPIVTTGGAQALPKLTETQAKDVGFAARLEEASNNLDDQELALTGFVDSNAGKVPIVGNYLTSSEYRSAMQAAKEWLAPILRKDTGAAVTDREFEFYGDIYLPVPGDDDATIAQKREARARAVQGLNLGLGQAEIYLEEMKRRRAGAAPSAAPGPDATLEERKAYISGLSDEELEALASGDSQ